MFAGNRKTLLASTRFMPREGHRTGTLPHCPSFVRTVIHEGANGMYDFSEQDHSTLSHVPFVFVTTGVLLFSSLVGRTAPS